MAPFCPSTLSLRYGGRLQRLSGGEGRTWELEVLLRLRAPAAGTVSCERKGCSLRIRGPFERSSLCPEGWPWALVLGALVSWMPPSLKP